MRGAYLRVMEESMLLPELRVLEELKVRGFRNLRRYLRVMKSWWLRRTQTSCAWGSRKEGVSGGVGGGRAIQAWRAAREAWDSSEEGSRPRSV